MGSHSCLKHYLIASLGLILALFAARAAAVNDRHGYEHRMQGLLDAANMLSTTSGHRGKHGSQPPSGKDTSKQKQDPAPLRYPVWWFGPYWSGTGYSSEAINYVLSMLRSRSLQPSDIWASHHGDTDRTEVRQGMKTSDRMQLQHLETNVNHSKPAIVVCHSLPTNWMLPSPMGWAGAKCPPDPREFAYVYLVGRTMFETDRLPHSFVPRCNAMNEIWVPSNFSRDVFISSGVDASKIRVVPEGINTTAYDPDQYTPIDMPQGELVFGTAPTHPPAGTALVDDDHDYVTSLSQLQAPGYNTGLRDVLPRKPSSPATFRFLSTFKWEGRKGWDVLLDAYLSEFTAEDDVELIIITKPFMGGGDFKRQMLNWAEKKGRERYNAAHPAAQQKPEQQPDDDDEAVKPGDAGPTPSPDIPPFQFNASKLPRLYVVHHHISDADLPRFYRACDAFVLPSRGEGWGRPHVEAMSMGLPVIATNWSGITAYLDDTVGYPIKVEGLVPADHAVWWFRGLRWAQPSVEHLKQLLRRVYTNRDEAKQKGAAARQLMLSKFSPDAIAEVLAREVRRINDLIP